MSTRDLPRDSWRTELDSFSRQHEGWLVRVSVTDPDGRTRTEARDMPLQGVSMDDPANDRVAVIVGREAGDHVTHEIERPVSIVIDVNADGAERAVRIRADDGSTTDVEFRSPTRPEDVDGMPAR